MARVVLKLGDIFEVPLGSGKKKYFQYIAIDESQLHSQVIRAFQRTYDVQESPRMNDIVRDEVAFYAHVFLKVGVKQGYWNKTGNVPFDGRIDVLFRGTNDAGNPEIKISEKWYVWRVNEPFVRVGKLVGDYRKAEIGVVVTPEDIVHRIKTGEYDFVYPAF